MWYIRQIFSLILSQRLKKAVKQVETHKSHTTIKMCIYSTCSCYVSSDKNRKSYPGRSQDPHPTRKHSRLPVSLENSNRAIVCLLCDFFLCISVLFEYRCLLLCIVLLRGRISDPRNIYWRGLGGSYAECGIVGKYLKEGKLILGKYLKEGNYCTST